MQQLRIQHTVCQIFSSDSIYENVFELAYVWKARKWESDGKLTFSLENSSYSFSKYWQNT